MPPAGGGATQRGGAFQPNLDYDRNTGEGGGRGVVIAQNAVVIDDATIDELQARLRRLRGETE
jgi:hypothetical protein